MLQGAPFIVSTHHRCGIVLMRNVFEEVCAAPGLSFCKAPGRDRMVPEGFAVVQDSNARLRRPREAVGIHLFRDPFDMLISHIRHAETTRDPAQPANRLRMADGRPYKAHLLERPTLAQKAMFEIDHIYGRTLRDMIGWDYDDPRFLNIALEAFGEAFGEAGMAADIAAEIGRRFAVFRGREERLEAAVRAVAASGLRERRTMRPEGERGIHLLPRCVIAHLHRVFPGLGGLVARLDAWRLRPPG